MSIDQAKAVWRELPAWFRQHCTATRMALALGILLRLADYGMDRPPWLDEESLAENVVGRPLFEFDQTLTRYQLAPPGYLLAARVSSRLFGHSWFALRSSSLACSIAALFVAALLGRRLLSPRTTPVALLLMAVSDDLLYYAGEFKQYSSDTLITLGCAWMIYELSRRSLGLRMLLGAVFLGSLAVWVSFPSMFVLAAGGLWLGLSAIRQRKFRTAWKLVGIGVCWLVNFAACYAVSTRMLGGSHYMWDWWGFSFLPIPPVSRADWTHWFWTLANLPVNPGGLDTPFSPIGTGLLGLFLSLLGLARLVARRSWEALMLLAGPLVLAILASAAHLYPFHGRVILFLAPALLMGIAEGIGWFPWRAVRVALIGVFLVVPLEHWLVIPSMHSMRGIDSHGDQRNDLLDYLEYLDSRR